MTLFLSHLSSLSSTIPSRRLEVSCRYIGLTREGLRDSYQDRQDIGVTESIGGGRKKSDRRRINMSKLFMYLTLDETRSVPLIFLLTL